MPRARKPGALAPKSRSRNGCWPCKGRKVKCGEEHPSCLNCLKLGDTCDYSIRLNWGGRRTKRSSQSLAGLPVSSPAQQTCRDPEPSLVLKRSHTFPTAASSSQPDGGPATYHQSPSTSACHSSGRGSRERTEYKDDTFHVPRASSSSSFFGKGASSIAVPTAAVKPSWSIFGSQAETLPAVSTDIGNLHASPARHRRAKSLAEYADLLSDWQLPVMSSPSPQSTSSPCPQLSMAHHEYSSVSHGSPVTPTMPTALSDEKGGRADKGMNIFSPRVCHSMIHQTEGSSQVEASLLLPLPMPPFIGPDTAGAYGFYGFDVGAQDRDIGRNDDAACVPYIGLPATPSHDGVQSSSKPLGNHGNLGHRGIGGYYDSPVPILISRHLEPLPEKLLGSRMNLMYFHHFINHTARVFVPFDDLLSNAFHTVLPRIAVKDDTLLSLLLAYSASHRAKVLRHAEPAMRMATWVEDIFPALRRTLNNDDDEPMSDARLATAIMLASLEIISPAAFGFDIPWQKHLSTARSLMAKRLKPLATSGLPRGDAGVISFLWSWLAYLDVVGSLSGGVPADASDGESPLPMLPGLDQDPDEIDCIMGFSIRCLGLLSQVARHVGRCRGQHLHHGGRVADRETNGLAMGLDRDLRRSMALPAHACGHVRPGALDADDRDEMAAVNESFHLAGLIHLHRRVLGKAASHPDVAVLVEQVLGRLEKVRRGGSAEAAMLFPMFTAGCDVVDDDGCGGGGGRRARLLERFRSVEASGMTQVRWARRLMETAWVTRRPWETLMTTEFIG